MPLALIPWPHATPPTEPALRRDLPATDIFRWHDAPSTHYSPHSHDHDETIALLDGELTFHAAGRDFRLRPGDRLTLPAGTVHTADAGPAGATYLIAQHRA